MVMLAIHEPFRINDCMVSVADSPGKAGQFPGFRRTRAGCFRATEGDLAYEPKGAVMTPFQSLNTRLQAFAVLSERGPLRLEELATELEQRGGFLRCGLESLRKALNRGPYRVALDPDHRDF